MALLRRWVACMSYPNNVLLISEWVTLTVAWLHDFSAADILFTLWKLKGYSKHTKLHENATETFLKTVEVSSYIWLYCNKDRAPLNTSLTVPRTRAELSRLTVYMPCYSGKWKQMGSGQGEGLYFKATLHKFTFTCFRCIFKKIKSLTLQYQLYPKFTSGCF